MLIPNELLAVGLGGIAAMQGWSMKELIKLKVTVGKIETKLDLSLPPPKPK